MASRLNNYLRTFRKRSGLSQEEVAFLLGCERGSKISRYERSVRVPTLTTALAYEAIFGVPTRELFAGAYERLQRQTRRRARTLAKRIEAEVIDKLALHKLTSLKKIVSSDEDITDRRYECTS